MAFVCLVDVNPDCCCLVDSSPNPIPRTYLYLLGGVVAVLLCLITTDLRLGSGGGACCRMGCCSCLTAVCCGWGEGAIWWC